MQITGRDHRKDDIFVGLRTAAEQPSLYLNDTRNAGAAFCREDVGLGVVIGRPKKSVAGCMDIGIQYHARYNTERKRTFSTMSASAAAVLVRFCGGSSPMTVAEETNVPSPSPGGGSFSSGPSASLALKAAKAPEIEPRSMVPDVNLRRATEESEGLGRFRPLDRFRMSDGEPSVDLRKQRGELGELSAQTLVDNTC